MAICSSKALGKLREQEVDAPLSKSEQVAQICQLHTCFLRAGVTSSMKLQCKMARGSTAGVSKGSNPILAKPQGPLQINLFRRKIGLSVFEHFETPFISNLSVLSINGLLEQSPGSW